jgi:hypothetical protein
MKNVEQLTKITTAEGSDWLHVIDKSQGQDMKMAKADFHNSKPYGEFYLSANSTQVAIASTAYYPIDNNGVTTLAGGLNKFTHTNNKLTYNGVEDAVCRVNLSGTYYPASSSARVFVAVFINGVIVNQGVSYSFIADPSEVQNIANSFLVTLAKGDFLQVYIRNLSGAIGLIPYYVNLNVAQV